MGRNVAIQVEDEDHYYCINLYFLSEGSIFNIGCSNVVEIEL